MFSNVLKGGAGRQHPQDACDANLSSQLSLRDFDGNHKPMTVNYDFEVRKMFSQKSTR